MKHTVKYLAILLLAVTAAASAQTFDPVGTGVISQQLSSTMVPENPSPGQEVVITLSAYGFDINASAITWFVNGGQSAKGTGMNQFTVAAGRNGETKIIKVTVAPPRGSTVTRSFTISPQDVSILYESDGYVHPFYKGKGVYGKESTVTLVAMPNLISNGARLSPSTLNYKWTVGGTVLGSKSGYGKNSLVYTGSILAKDTLVQVEVTSSNKAVTGLGTILLSPRDPQVFLYEQHPLYGILYNKELSANGLILTGKEVTIASVPYSTSASRLDDGTLSHTWSINGAVIPVPKTQSFATFRNSTGQEGSSVIGLTVSNTTHLLQMMRNTLSINF
jgi:hypothetical protein